MGLVTLALLRALALRLHDCHAVTKGLLIQVNCLERMFTQGKDHRVFENSEWIFKQFHFSPLMIHSMVVRLN
jgi:hypothetical protein